ncbi:hypothetical protein M405DRAFT_938834, partial [Rhizopogon salebrosus TDB-379]
MNIPTESPLSLIPLQGPSSGHASMVDNTTPLSPEQSLLNPKNYVIIIQDNCIAEGGTINIFSGHCTGSAMTKLDKAVPTPKHTSLQSPLTMQPEPMVAPVKQGHDSIIFSGNSLC